MAPSARSAYRSSLPEEACAPTQDLGSALVPGSSSRSRIPTLLIAGGEDLLVPRARLKTLEEAGHAVTIERTGEVDALIAEFARSVA